MPFSNGITPLYPGNPVEVRCLDRAAVAAEIAVTRVVEHDQQDIRGALLGADGRRPRRARLLSSAADHPRERRTRFVLDDGHRESLRSLTIHVSEPIVPWLSSRRHHPIEVIG